MPLSLERLPRSVTRQRLLFITFLDIFLYHALQRRLWIVFLYMPSVFLLSIRFQLVNNSCWFGPSAIPFGCLEIAALWPFIISIAILGPIHVSLKPHEWKRARCLVAYVIFLDCKRNISKVSQPLVIFSTSTVKTFLGLYSLLFALLLLLFESLLLLHQ